jgi:hypothetical protein
MTLNSGPKAPCRLCPGACSVGPVLEVLADVDVPVVIPLVGAVAVVVGAREDAPVPVEFAVQVSWRRTPVIAVPAVLELFRPEPASKIGSFEPTQAGNVGSAACAS